MSDGPEAKRAKSVINNDGVRKKKTYRPKKKKFIQVGQRGFFATCNFQERECVRECYNVLNRYADELYGPEDTNPENQEESSDSPESEEEQDIASSLEKEVAHTSKQGMKKAVKRSERAARKAARLAVNSQQAAIQQAIEGAAEAAANANRRKRIKNRFTYLNSGANNCIFIRSIAPVEPTELGMKIVENVSANGRQITRSLLRLIPMEIVCHAELGEIVDKAGELFDKHFLRQGCTFSIVYNKRFNNNIKRDDIIRELAALIQGKNPGNKVNLSSPQKTVVVEIIKGLALITVLPDYLKYKKYNLIEMTNTNPTPPPAPRPNGTANGIHNGHNQNNGHDEGMENDDNIIRATIPLDN